MRLLRAAQDSHSWFVHLPIALFGLLLQLCALLTRQPAFTKSQLRALTAGHRFEVIDWPANFPVAATPLTEDIRLTYTDFRFRDVEIPY